MAVAEVEEVGERTDGAFGLEGVVLQLEWLLELELVFEGALVVFR